MTVKLFKKNRILSALLILTILVCIWCSLRYYHATSDDGYYLPRSMEVITSNSLSVPASVSWYGELIPGYPDLTDASTLSFFIAYLSSLTGIHPTVLSRNGFALIMIIVHYSSVLALFDTVYEGQYGFQVKTVSLILYTAFIFLAEKVCSAGVWLSRYIWEGKSLLSATTFPLLFASCGIIIRRINIIKKREWLSVFFILTAGIGLSTVGLFLPVILFFGIGAAFLFATRFKCFRKIWFPVLLTLLPVILCGIISYFLISTHNTYYFTIGGSDIWSWKGQALRAFDIPQLFLYIISLIYCLIKGTPLQKILFVFTPLVLLVTFLNPFLCEIVSTYITTKEVYWRLFWILPIYTFAAMALSELFVNLCRGKVETGILVITASLSFLLLFEWKTYYIIRPDLSNIKALFHIYYPRRNNTYSISPTSLAIASRIESDWDETGRPHLLSAHDNNFEIRQYSNKIIEYYAGNKSIIPHSDITQQELLECYEKINDGYNLIELLTNANADYVCFSKNRSITDLDRYGFELLYDSGELELWKIPVLEN